MTRAQLDEARKLLGFAAAASNEGVLRAIGVLRHADRHRTDPTAVSQALAAAASLAWRLIDGEAERTAFRSTIARLHVANQHGDDYGLGDLAFELERASIDLTDEYDVANDLARAAGREGLL
ncbi:hypothetical protein [Streptomyces sp. NPDC050988]|uniref:hypothetical protein n=1 Tax=Streptomyces sp. NPDC050988 TaxID=3365637 RepID=UPI0037AE292F